MLYIFVKIYYKFKKLLIKYVILYLENIYTFFELDFNIYTLDLWFLQLSGRPGIGTACAAVIAIDGWRIKDDYPW